MASNLQIGGSTTALTEPTTGPSVRTFLRFLTGRSGTAHLGSFRAIGVHEPLLLNVITPLGVGADFNFELSFRSPARSDLLRLSRVRHACPSVIIVFGSLCARPFEFETLFLPIDLEVDLKLRTAKVDIPGVVRSRGRPIINKFNGEPFHIALARDAAPSAPPDDPGNPTVDFHGERRRNDTHQSTTDPEAMLHRKGQGKEAKLAYLGHVLLDNRHGLVANVCATHATGTAEREAAALLLEASAPPGSTVGADKGYDVASFVADVRVRDVTPHVAQKVRWSAIDGRTTRHAGYHVSQRKRKLVEQVFGWMKTVGGLRKLRHRGVPLVDWQLTFAATAYNLVRLRNLEATCP